MTRAILLGCEAIARAAIDAGISGAYAYPGTPSTEIFEAVHRHNKRDNLGLHTRWSANEKVAMEEALGMSYAGRRALVSMKHVGLNVAADPFMNAAVSGAHGGLVIAVADDPSMHSSQNEQDSRYFADFAQVPCFEPHNQQVAYDMTREAFDLSERLKVPVVLRLVTRLAHSRAIVEMAPPHSQNPANYVPDYFTWTLLPSNARVAYGLLLKKGAELSELSNAHPHNALTLAGQGKPGIIATGLGRGYLDEALGDRVADYNILRIGMYPMPERLISELVAASSEVTVLEEGYPFVERLLRGVGAPPPKPLRGRLTGAVPRAGELNPDIVKAAFGLPSAVGMQLPEAADVLKSRPPLLCDGCPHTDSYRAMTEALKAWPGSRVMGDIGCYTLGYYEPHNAIQSCIAMGASISMASGVSHAGIRPVVAVIGDSTFTHSGMTPLLDAARENTPMTVFILDNSIVAMTGGQPTLASHDDLIALLTGLGVPREHVVVLNPSPKYHEENVAAIHKELAYEGLSVVVTVRACVTYAKEIKEIERERQALKGVA